MESMLLKYQKSRIIQSEESTGAEDKQNFQELIETAAVGVRLQALKTVKHKVHELHEVDKLTVQSKRLIFGLYKSHSIQEVCGNKKYDLKLNFRKSLRMLNRQRSQGGLKPFK